MTAWQEATTGRSAHLVPAAPGHRVVSLRHRRTGLRGGGRTHAQQAPRPPGSGRNGCGPSAARWRDGSCRLFRLTRNHLSRTSWRPAGHRLHPAAECSPATWIAVIQRLAAGSLLRRHEELPVIVQLSGAALYPVYGLETHPSVPARSSPRRGGLMTARWADAAAGTVATARAETSHYDI